MYDPDSLKSNIKSFIESMDTAVKHAEKEQLRFNRMHAANKMD